MYATMFSTDLTPDQVFANFGLAGGSTYQMSSYVNPDDKLESFYGRFGYNYKDKYLLTFTFRTDGSSKFMKGNQWGYFPAALPHGALMKSRGWREHVTGCQI